MPSVKLSSDSLLVVLPEKIKHDLLYADVKAAPLGESHHKLFFRRPVPKPVSCGKLQLLSLSGHGHLRLVRL